MGTSSNSTPPDHKFQVTTSGGEDWLEAALDVSWTNWPCLLNHLEHAQAQARVSAVDPGATLGTTVPLHADPAGGRAGSTTCNYMRWGLQSQWGRLFLSGRPATRQYPNLKVRIAGHNCLVHGAAACWAGTLHQIEELGDCVERGALVRVDMATDVAGVGIESLDKAYALGAYTSRAHRHKREVSSGVTLTFGAKPIQLKIYDKAAELRSANEVKHQAMLDRRYGGVWPPAAIRAEYQVEREALVGFGIYSVEDYFKRRADLVDRLVKQTHFYSPRAGTRPCGLRHAHPHWLAIVEGFRTWAGKPSGQPMVPLPKRPLDPVRHMKAAIGSFIAAAAAEDLDFDSTEQFEAYIANSISNPLRNIPWKDRLAIKRRAIDQGTP